MASTYLQRTQGTPTSNQKGTVSFWIKRGTLGNARIIVNYVSSLLYSYIDFRSDDQLRVNVDDSSILSISCNRKFRDVNAWYHIVFSIDTTQSTASDRCKIYVNGVQETSFLSATYPSQNASLNMFNASASNGNVIGAYYNGSSHSGHYGGSMSHFHFIDGTAYDASAFGETDSTTGEWKIKTSPSVTYGTNGFFILKDGNSVTDQSGNGNNFTVGGGTLTKTEDSPSNVFATLNPLNYSSVSKTYGHGNNSITASDSNSWNATLSNFAVSSGKWYTEYKITAVGSYSAIGVGYQPFTFNASAYLGSTFLVGEDTGSFGWQNNGDTRSSNASGTLSSWTTNDILMIALDMDNQKLYVGKNGTWENSGNPESGATGTGSVKDLTAGEDYLFVICPRGGGTSVNFGNGYFGTTAVSSAGTNASGNGIFEYDVPTGYTALSTKGLNL
jgi:hypothetical protein